MPIKKYAFLFLLFPLLSEAQVVSNGGRFAVDFDLGCNPFEVNVIELDTFGNITRQYFYEPGATETTSTNYTYSVAGTYEIVQVVGIDVTPKTDTVTIQVVDPTPTSFAVEKCNFNGIAVTSTEQTYDFIRVYFTPTDSATLNVGETASFNYPSAASQTFDTKGFYTNGKENCTQFSHTIDPLAALATPTILSASILETCRDYFVLEMDISSYDSLIDYQVVLEQPNETIIYSGAIANTHVVIEDVPYNSSETQYCVKINALDNCLTSVIEGTQFCQQINALSTTPFENLYATYTSNSVFLNLGSVSAGTMEVYRKFGIDGNYELRNTTQDAFNDPIGSLARTYFYRIDYVDSCQEVLYSAETNPPLLNTNTIQENRYLISYTDPVNTLNDITSITYELGNAGEIQEPISQSTFEIGLDPINGTRQFLQATIEYQDGTTIQSNQLVYKYKPVIHVPTAFTPNNDGLNDTLELFGLPTQVATTNIYTKWGQLIYSSTEPSPGWDGFIAGSLAPEGAYLYEIIFEDSDGVQVVQKGTFALLKK